MRLFYASYLGRENMRAYQTLVDQLIEDVPGTLRSVPLQTHHLTLAFLGEIADADGSAYCSALDTLEGTEAFAYSLGPPAILMGRGQPRLIHARVIENAEAIAEVQSRLLTAVRGLLPSIDSRPKPPHVTLARFKRSAKRWQTRQMRQALERVEGSLLPETDRFSSVHLVESTLTPSGPSYETLREIRLSDPDER